MTTNKACLETNVDDGWHEDFHLDELDGKAVRLVAAWNTKDSDVDELLNTIKAN